MVAAGYGITAPELGVDDYKGVEVKGKIVVVRRFTPTGAPFDQPDAERRYGDLRYKAWNAREHGAAGLVVVDLPAGTPGDEAPLPALTIDNTGIGGGDAGLPVVVVKRAAGARLFEPGARAELNVDLERRTKPAVNVVAVLRAGAAGRLPGAVLVGAHYDHLGHGGSGSLTPDSRDVHNGADDNASGTAALLEVAGQLAAGRGRLRRDVYLVAFSGEESGVLGSTAFTRQPAAGLAMTDLAAMLNMDMVGRLRGNLVSVLGGESAEDWKALVDPACERALLLCSVSGEGYGPSDHSPFYAAGVPVLHFFSGTHDDYHKPSDDWQRVNAIGGVRIAGLVADLAAEIANRPQRLAYKSAPAPAPRGTAALSAPPSAPSRTTRATAGRACCWPVSGPGARLRREACNAATSWWSWAARPSATSTTSCTCSSARSPETRPRPWWSGRASGWRWKSSSARAADKERS